MISPKKMYFCGQKIINISMNKLMAWLGTLMFLALPAASHQKNNYKTAGKIRTIVIDAGHGGKDSGASGKTYREKSITLKIALLLGGYIEKNLPNVKVVYTRNSDVFLELHERAQLANNKKADLFISIHCNSLEKRKVDIMGSETYVMGLHTAEENLAVAKRENSVILMENNYKQNYGGFDPNSPEAHIMLSMYQNAHLMQSTALANKMENQLISGSKRPTRGVKQAGFMVLRATAMPSVLIETGFLSNDQDEAYIGSQKGQVYIASAIYRAVREYVEEVEEGKTPSTKALPAYTLPTAPKANEKNNVHTPTYTAGKIIYKVQLASSTAAINTNVSPWTNVLTIQREQVGSVGKYMVGDFWQYDKALAQQNYWRKNGFSDAFVVAYRGENRISIDEARKATEK
jgi:N-acetylmuramoyl-L-alanine amidase